MAGSSTALRLLALRNANGMPAPTTAGSSPRAGLPPGGSIFRTSAPRSANSRVTPSPSAPARSSTRRGATWFRLRSRCPRRQQPFYPIQLGIGSGHHIQQVDKRVGISVGDQQAHRFGDLLDPGAFGDIDPDVGGDVRQVASGGAGAASMACRCRFSASIRTRPGTRTAASPYLAHTDPLQPGGSGGPQIDWRTRSLDRLQATQDSGWTSGRPGAPPDPSSTTPRGRRAARRAVRRAG